MSRKPRNLSAEERELWARVASRTNRKNPLRTEPVIEARPVAHPKATTKRTPVEPFEIGAKNRTTAATRIDLAPPVTHRVAAETLSMDPKTHKRLAKGKLRPEARIDLHGMTLAQAQPALVGFILGSHAQGRRLVLVITGKGRGGASDGWPIPVRRGVLREEVPRWLRSAPCASVVLQVVQAHASHGGSGAWYVYLKRAR